MDKYRRLYRVCHVGGRTFRINMEYDDLVEHEVPVYPDFRENPEYTAEGRPFRTATDEGCPHREPVNPVYTEPQDCTEYGDCGGCAFFHREETPWDIIGVCMCEAQKKTPNEAEP